MPNERQEISAQDGGQVSLPHFVVRNAEGVFVDLTQFTRSTDFFQYVDRLFTTGGYFRGLDYPAFIRLAFDFEPGIVADTIDACTAAGRPPLIRFADGLSHILPARIGLYHAVKTTGGEAYYMFEPVTLDIELDEPVTEGSAQGGGAGGRAEKRLVQQKTRLDLDEFIAQMWLKGVRFGIDTEAVSQAITSDHVGRVVVARSLAPTPGQDAGVKELAEALHRDDAPRVLPDGRVDLASFSNRFPQIQAGTRLMQKTPLKLGVLGRELDGRPTASPVPKDFDMATLAGEGTRIERDAEGEFLVATMDGFLNLDTQTHQVSVMEKIINREGVSLRTTGDLVLMGDEYEEHGEIQERRTVQGRTITIHANVFGRVVSNGGTITLKKNLSGGAAINHDGPIVVEGLAASATLMAPQGEITVHRAENSLIVGRRVVVGDLATGCDILADEIVIAKADGCALAAKKVEIDHARAYGQNEMLVSMLLPDIDGMAEAVERARRLVASLDADDAKAREDMAALRAQPDLAKYLMLFAKIRRGEVALTADQKPAFQKLAERVAPLLKALGTLSEQSKAHQAQRSNLEECIAGLTAQRDAACAGVQCRIAALGGEVMVRTMKIDPQAPPLAHLPPAELKARLRASGQEKSLLFCDDSGSFEWQWTSSQ